MSADVSRKTTSQDRLPKAIGPYAIRERIGKGAMGVVYRAVAEGVKTEVALKVMASDLDGDPETRERFFREAHVAGRLRHRNIVAVRDSGEDSGRLYIAMELLRGDTLNEFMKQPGALDLEDRVDLMIQVCQGLAVAHAAGVFHRDLKPANLFVCEDRRIKILDFGVARLVGSNMTVTGNIIGTPDFMSPEQVRGEEIDGRSDIFSAGSVFYLLLTGRKPFAANDLPAVLNKVVRGQTLPIREDEAPEPIAAVIRKAMAKDPAARQQEISQLGCELMAAACAVQSGTRRLALTVQTVVGELTSLAARARDLAATLEIADGATPDPWTALHEQYPMLRNGSAALAAYPFRSRAVQELHDVIRAEVEAVSERVTQLEEGHAKLSAGVMLQAKGQDEQALQEFDAARRLVPASPLISRALEACDEAIEKRREREARWQARLAMATQAAERTDWDAVLVITAELEQEKAGEPLVARLRDNATRQLESARSRQARADSAARKSAAPPLRTATPMAGATGAETTVPPPGQPDLPPGERQARVTYLREQAARHLTGGDLVSAERMANEAMALNATDTQSRHVLERVRAAITLRTRQEETGRRIADLLRRADALADSQRFDKALALCDEALKIDPMHEGAVATQARLADEQAADAAARERDATRQRQLRAAAPVLQQAKRAFDAGDLERARWSAENALALAPDSHDAQALLAQITAAMPAPSADDTVKLGNPASEDTAELAPLQESVQERVRSQASSWLRQWRSSDSKTKG